jgi:hypothetical protein
MATGHLITCRDLALLTQQHIDALIDADRQFDIVITGKDLDIDDLAAHAVRHPQRRVLHFARFFAEDCPQQTLLSREIGFAFRCDLADENIVRLHLGADIDDAAIIQITQAILPDIRKGIL